MSSLPRVSYPGKQAWIGLLISGVWFLLLAMLLGFLAVPLGLIAWIVIHQKPDEEQMSAFRMWLIKVPFEV